MNRCAAVSVGIFVDKTHRPTEKEILAALGSKRVLREELTSCAKSNFRAKQSFAFYGKNYGWAVRFRKGGKALLSMYPGKQSFTVQVVLPEALAKKAMNLSLGKAVKQVLQSAHQFPEGRWLFIRPRSARAVADIKQLLAVKVGSTKEAP